MLNRRSLRIKAFKALFAFENCKEVNYNLALDRITRVFSPDLNSEEAYDLDELRAQEKEAHIAFKKFYNQYLNDEAINPQGLVEEAALDALIFCKDQNKKDQVRLQKDLIKDIEDVQRGQFSIFRILLDLAFQNKKLADEKSDYGQVITPRSGLIIKLYENKVISRIKESEAMILKKSEKDAHAILEEDIIRDWYKGIIYKDPVVKEYILADGTDYAKDWEILDYILRNIIFKNDVINNDFDSRDINWTENKAVIRSLTLRSLKSIKSADEPLQFAEISYSWEEDVKFLVDLFKKSAETNIELQKVITENLENWDINRIALTDKVILIVAICEMIGFPSIPIKVTINEYIDISKIYSTPKSKNFVNGMLDVISAILFENGTIKKSGRGLIDNK